jgi:hypothetical protein
VQTNDLPVTGKRPSLRSLVLVRSHSAA